MGIIGYKIVISSRPSHPYELRLNAYLISPSGAQTVLRGHNHVYSGEESMLRQVLKRDWPGLPIVRNDELYVVGIDPVPETKEKSHAIPRG